MPHLHYHILGSGTPLILLHGWAMHSGVWLDFAESLAARYQVILVDLPGHGLSASINPYTLTEVGDALITELPDQPCYWLGWSLGANIAIDIAGRYPHRVKSLIIMAGNPCFVQRLESEKLLWPGMQATVLQQFAEQLFTDTEGTLLRFLSLQAQGMTSYKPVLKKLRAVLSKYPAPNLAVLQGGLDLLKQTDLRPVVQNLDIPMLAILGAKDALVPKAIAAKLASLNPKMLIHCLAHAAHAPFLSDCRDSVNIICDFLNEHA